MVNELRQKIYDLLITMPRFSATNTFYKRARRNQTMPYMVFFNISDVSDRSTEAEFKEYVVQISTFDSHSNTATVAAEHEELESLITKQNLAGMDNYSVGICKRLNGGEPDTGEENTYHRFSTFRISIAKRQPTES